MKINTILGSILLGGVSLMGCKSPQTATPDATPTSIATPNVASITAVKKDSAFTLLSVDRAKKTIYRGLKNPLTIIVPNAVSTKVEGNGVMKVDDFGHYRITPGAGATSEIRITATMPDGSTYKDTKIFNVKNVPAPTVHLSQTKWIPGATQGSLTPDELTNAEISLHMIDFDYDLRFIVTGFRVLFPNGKSLDVEGTKLDAKALDMLKKVRHNAEIKIQNIRVAPVSGDDVLLFKPTPITIKVNKKARPKK